MNRRVSLHKEAGLIANRPVGLMDAAGACRHEPQRARRIAARLRQLCARSSIRTSRGCSSSAATASSITSPGSGSTASRCARCLTHLLPERLDVSEADDVVRAIGSALVYAHEHGVAHGDVRAENVLVTMDRRFVLTNFLARRVAKVAARAAAATDDVRGLARLAAELYTGSTSPHDVRAAFTAACRRRA